jgi:hypothetical protein
MNGILISASEKERANYYRDNPEARDKVNGAKIKAEVQKLKEEEEFNAKQLGRKPFTQPVLADVTFPLPSVTPSSASRNANTGGYIAPECFSKACATGEEEKVESATEASPWGESDEEG